MMRLLLVLLLAPLAAAQPSAPSDAVSDSVRPFETLAVTLGGAATLGTAPYTDVWTPGPGVEARVATPFYVGHFTVGVTAAQHDERAEGPAVPGYLALYFFGVWSADLALPGGLRLAPGVQAGLFRMQFDTDDIGSVRNESELAAGPEVWLSAPVYRGWRVAAGAGFARVFTAERIDFGFVRVGVSRTIRTPGWLRDVLASDGPAPGPVGDDRTGRDDR